MTQDVYIDGLEGLWRVLWLGGSRQLEGHSQLHVDVVFVEEPPPRDHPARWRVKQRPIEELGLYGVQALWRNGRCIGYDAKRHPVKTLTVKPTPIRSGYPAGWQSPFTEEDYPLHGRKLTAGCYVFDTEEGIELVVPCWQILHAWYLFDPVVTPYVLGGMLDAVEVYGTATPWLPGTRCEGDKVIYHAPPGLSDYNAKAIGRLLFDHRANYSARMIHRKLVENRTRLPLIWPPHRLPARWTFRMRRLDDDDVGRQRWLLLHLCGADVPLSFSEFEIVTEMISHEEDVDLKPSVAKIPAVPRGKRSPLPLAAGRTGARRAGVGTFPAMGFVDQAVEQLDVTRQLIHKEPKNINGVSIVLTEIDSEIEAASMTRLGPEDKSVLSVRPRSPEKDAEESETLFRRTRSAFEAVIDYLAGQPHPRGLTWSGRFIHSGTEECFVVGGAQGRKFLVLEMRTADIYTYVVDVFRQPDDAEYSLAMMRGVGARELGLEHLQAWLRGFPFAGDDPWGDAAQIPRLLLKSIPIRHQTTQLPRRIEELPEPERQAVAESHYTHHFRDRLIRFVDQYEVLHANGLRRIEKRTRRRRQI
ncbi:hypothetical protein I5T99_06985 [Stenotrophomonas maltophilia]|nr:hypothetical protein [Stenotrophomonas maltophilia]